MIVKVSNSVISNKSFGDYQKNYSDIAFGSSRDMRRLGRFFDFALSHQDNMDAILKKADKIDLEKLLSESRKKVNYLGEGAYSETYQVNKKYVLQFYKTLTIKNNNTRDIIFSKNSPLDSLKLWKGSILLKLGQIKLLRNANPARKAIEAGVPYSITSMEKIKEYYKNVYLPKCFKLPQKAFDSFAFDFKKINDAAHSLPCKDLAYLFDFVNPNNILIGRRTIATIDDIEITRGRDFNNMSAMVGAFLNRYNLGLQVTEFDPSLAKMRMNILKKCILASEKAELPLKNISDSSMNWAFVLSGQDGKWKIVKEQINNLRESCSSPNIRVKKLEQFLNHIDSIEAPETFVQYAFV